MMSQQERITKSFTTMSDLSFTSFLSLRLEQWKQNQQLEQKLKHRTSKPLPTTEQLVRTTIETCSMGDQPFTKGVLAWLSENMAQLSPALRAHVEQVIFEEEAFEAEGLTSSASFSNPFFESYLAQPDLVAVARSSTYPVF